MSNQSPAHNDRHRAGSFGSIAVDYDRYRPRFPNHTVDTVAGLAAGGHVVDVGAGTGIFTAQLRDHGVKVSAVEPDPEMADVARGKGLQVDIASFETWDPQHCCPAVLVFANAWHWVDPTIAIPKTRAILNAGGHLILIWHALVPAGPAAADIDAVYARHQLPTAQPAPSRPDTSTLEESGFSVTTTSFLAGTTWDTGAWLDQQFTVSTHVVLDAAVARRLRGDLLDAVGTEGLATTEQTHVITALRT